MLLSSIAALGAVALGQPASAFERPTEVPRLALEVLNPLETGRRILQLDLSVGPQARKIGRLAPASALLVVATAIDGCERCPGDLSRLGALHRRVAKRGGRIVAVVLTSPKRADTAREQLAHARHPFFVTLDAFGIARDRLALVGPGAAVVIRSDGTVIGHYAPGAQALDAAVAAFLRELEEDRP